MPDFRLIATITVCLALPSVGQNAAASKPMLALTYSFAASSR